MEIFQIIVAVILLILTILTFASANARMLLQCNAGPEMLGGIGGLLEFTYCYLAIAKPNTLMAGTPVMHYANAIFWAGFVAVFLAELWSYFVQNKEKKQASEGLAKHSK